MRFSFDNYQNGLSLGLYAPPDAYRPFMRVNRAQYRELEQQHNKNGNDIKTAFRELRRRVDSQYYWRTYPIQARALDYSQLSFPAYRFILPEVLTDDWLAIVDWHKYQRDHVLHQPLTSYIILKLLKGADDKDDAFRLADGRTLLDACVEEIIKWQGTAFLRQYLMEIGVNDLEMWFQDNSACRQLWKSLFVEAAYIAALFHDMGYPWQYVNLLSNKLENAGYQPDTTYKNAEKLISSFGSRLLFCPFNGYCLLNRNAPSTWPNKLVEITEKSLRKTHGFPGAIGFLYLNDVLRDFPSDISHPIKQFCVDWASMAIMMHDMSKIYWGNDTATPPSNPHMRLKFNVDPLSCVVTLADVLQEFSRPVASFNENGSVVEVHYSDGCNYSDIELYPAIDGIKIILGFSDKNALASKRYWISNDEHEYFDTRYGFVDLSSIGIYQVSMEANLIP